MTFPLATEIDPNTVRPGWVALLIVLALGAATVLLWRNMGKQLKKIDFDPDAGAGDQARSAARPAAAGPDGAGPDAAGSDAATPKPTADALKPTADAHKTSVDAKKPSADLPKAADAPRPSADLPQGTAESLQATNLPKATADKLTADDPAHTNH